MDRSVIAKEVADKVIALEHAMDDTLARYGELLITLTEARRNAGLSAVVGQDQVFGRIPAVGASIIAARGDAVQLHHGLAALQRALKVTMSPPEDKDPDSVPAFAPSASTPLRRVA